LYYGFALIFPVALHLLYNLVVSGLLHANSILWRRQTIRRETRLLCGGVFGIAKSV